MDSRKSDLLDSGVIEIDDLQIVLEFKVELLELQVLIKHTCNGASKAFFIKLGKVKALINGVIILGFCIAETK